MDEIKKGRVCVTGGTGFLGSWMVKKLLEHGYSVNTTTRINPDNKRDISYLTNLPGASDRLQIFQADLDRPDSFVAAIEGCVGVFHMAHPIDIDEKEEEEVKIQRAINGTIGILQACLDSKTVARVVYTTSMGALGYKDKVPEMLDESSWSDVDYIRGLKMVAGQYLVTKTLTEKQALDFSDKHGLDLITVAPSLIHGPFFSPGCPGSVHIAMSLFFFDEKYYFALKKSSLVHVEDVARAHIHLFEYPNAKGRYICSGVETPFDKLYEFLSMRYPEYKLSIDSIPDSLKDLGPSELPSHSSKKLLETGFKYKHGLQEMFDGAIRCCKERGIL